MVDQRRERPKSPESLYNDQAEQSELASNVPGDPITNKMEKGQKEVWLRYRVSHMGLTIFTQSRRKTELLLQIIIDLIAAIPKL